MSNEYIGPQLKDEALTSMQLSTEEVVETSIYGKVETDTDGNVETNIDENEKANTQKINDFNINFDGLTIELDNKITESVKNETEEIKYLKVLSQWDYNTSQPDNNTLYFINNISEPTSQVGYIIDMIANEKNVWILTYKQEYDEIDDIDVDKVILWEAKKKNGKINQGFVEKKKWNGFKSGKMTLDGKWQYHEGENDTAILETVNEPFICLISVLDELYAFPNLSIEADIVKNAYTYSDEKLKPYKIAGEYGYEEILEVSIEKGYCSERFKGNDQGIVVAYISRYNKDNSYTCINYRQYGYSNNDSVAKVWTLPIRLCNESYIYHVSLRRLNDYRLGIIYNYKKIVEGQEIDTTVFRYSSRVYAGIAIREEVIQLPVIENNIYADYNNIGFGNILYGAVRNDNIDKIPAINMDIQGPVVLWAANGEGIEVSSIDVDVIDRDLELLRVEAEEWENKYKPSEAQIEAEVNKVVSSYDDGTISPERLEEIRQDVRNEMVARADASYSNTVNAYKYRPDLMYNNGYKDVGELSIVLRFFTQPISSEELRKPLTFEVISDSGNISTYDFMNNIVEEGGLYFTEDAVYLGNIKVNIISDYPYNDQKADYGRDPKYYHSWSKAVVQSCRMVSLTKTPEGGVRGKGINVGAAVIIGLKGLGYGSGRRLGRNNQDIGDIINYAFWGGDTSRIGPMTSFKVQVSSIDNQKQDIHIRFLADDLCNLPNYNYEMGGYFSLSSEVTSEYYYQGDNEEHQSWGVGNGFSTAIKDDVPNISEKYGVKGLHPNFGLGELPSYSNPKSYIDFTDKLDIPQEAYDYCEFYCETNDTLSILSNSNQPELNINLNIHYNISYDAVTIMPQTETTELRDSVYINYIIGCSATGYKGEQIDV